VLHAQDHAENIGLKRRGKTFRGLIRDRTDLAFGGGIVHRDIDTAKPCDGLVDHGADIVLLADVGIDELGLRTERAEFLSERLAGLITPTGNDHLGALPGEGDGGCESTGDQDNLRAHGTILLLGAAGNPTAVHILCSGFSPRSLVELSAEHWQTTL
jgi:serine/threonine protein kinase